MADFAAAKYVSSLPGTLAANTAYFVRSGSGFDLWVSDSTGTAAYPLNPSDAADIADLKLRMARVEMQDQINRDIEAGKYVWGWNYSKDTGIDVASTGYHWDSVNKLVCNQSLETISYTLGTNNYGAANNRVFVFDNTTFSGDFTAIRVTFDITHAGTTWGTIQASVSTQAPSGDAYDSDTDLAQLYFNDGDSTFTTDNDLEVVSDWLEFAGDSSKNILIAFDSISDTASRWQKREALPSGVTAYYGSADQALTQDRSGMSSDSYLWGIKKIEYLSEGQVMTLLSPDHAGIDVDQLEIQAEYNAPDENITLGTNLEYFVSIDGGTTWAEVDFSGGPSYSSGVANLVSGVVDVSAQTGTDWKMKIATSGGTPPLAEILWWVGKEI